MSSDTELIESFFIANYISILYIIPIIVLLCGAMLYFFRWSDYMLPLRIMKRKQAEAQQNQDKEWPKLSVIVPANEQAALLAENLPKILDQVYPDFEVIVVDEASTDETAELIKQLQLKYRNLRRTFIPFTATDICKRKLSITLGVRAARSEWAIITTASSSPVSRLWLQKLAEEIDENVDIILGYGNYVDEQSAYSQRAIFERMWTQLRCFSAAEKGTAIGGDETCFCIRKSSFLAHKGYADKLQNDFGESHLLIQTLAKKGNTRLALSPEAKMIEELPLELLWQNIQIYYRETLKYSTLRTKMYLKREGIASLIVYLLAITFSTYLMLRCFQTFTLCDYNLKMLYIDAVMLVFLATFVFLPVTMLRKCTKVLNEPKYGWTFIHYILTRPFSNLALKIQRWKLQREFNRS